MAKLGTLLILLAMLVGCSPPQTESQRTEGEPDAGTIAYDKGDYQSAFSEWLALAEQGHANAQYGLGVLYDNGKGVVEDHREAAKWYRKAAEQGHANAQYNLGMLYDFGEGVARDYREAAKWYRKAAEQGDAMAQNNLGAMYRMGYGGVFSSGDKEAARWYRKAAEQGYGVAQHNLGVLYKTGQGVVRDDKEAAKWFSEAAKWYRTAAEQGDASAQKSLGVIYAEGEGVAQDYEEAAKWIRKAAGQGDAAAQYMLGDMYRKGLGVVRDNKEAIVWLQKAADNGYTPASDRLALIARREDRSINVLSARGEWFDACSSPRCGRALQFHADITNNGDEPFIGLKCEVFTTLKYTNGHQQKLKSENLCDDRRTAILAMGGAFGDAGALSATMSDYRWSIQPKEKREIRACCSTVATVEQEYYFNYEIESVRVVLSISGETPFGDPLAETPISISIPPPTSGHSFSLLSE